MFTESRIPSVKNISYKLKPNNIWELKTMTAHMSHKITATKKDAKNIL